MLTLTNRIDMRPGAVPLIIHLGQYDSDFSLIFELYSSAGNFTVESGTTAMIRGTKTDGHAYDADATVDVSAKTVTVAGSEQMTAAKGRNVYELVLTKSGKVLSTANFILDVERAAMDADTIASESVLKELNAIIDSAATSTQAAADASSAADRAEDAADSVSSASAQIATNTADIADLKADFEQFVPGLSDEAKAALLACFRHIAFLDHDEDYYDDLETALYPDSVRSITATFSQGANIITATDNLDDLRDFLTVIASLADGTQRTVTDYTLAGNLSLSQSVITVAYLTKTTTFTVNVKQLPSGYTQKNYVLSDTSQLIKTDISEAQMRSYAFRYKVMPIVADFTIQHNMHIFSSLNWYTPTVRFMASFTKAYTAPQRYGTATSSSSFMESNNEYVFEAYKNASDAIIINGEEVATCALGETYSEANKLYLLGYSGVEDSMTKFRFSGRTYYFKIYDSVTNAKVYDFIPCMNSGGTVGFYDLVNDRFMSPSIGTLNAG